MRGIVVSFTARDDSTGLLTNIIVLYELTSSGIYSTSRIEIIPFFLPFASELYSQAITLVVFRVINLAGLLGLIVSAMLKRNSLLHVISITMLRDVANFVVLFIFQLLVLSYQLRNHTIYKEMNAKDPSEIYTQMPAIYRRLG